ncbi:tigger transposable element-derived protein 6-like [Rhipicephalus sanguineus]|uniref:tigger transposable element-derived protein 6-like n=1 Tax=Rhipicephalus sanguineus TaxID=34632 RepID=UPI00189517B8|nr:tigger transposable element-derived protein 6-like [Rhipicephalus sanguineus]
MASAVSAACASGVKKRRALSLETKECVIRDMESGLKKASVAAKYGVSDTTVSTIYKNKDKLRQQLQQDSSSLSRKRIRTSKYEDLDAALFRWFREVRAQSIPVSGPMLQQKAKSLGALLGHDDFNPLNGWIQRFKDRHGISCKVVCGESGDVDDESIEVWLNL